MGKAGLPLPAPGHTATFRNKKDFCFFCLVGFFLKKEGKN